MELSHIEHLGIAVKSLDEAIPYYENMLGLKCYSIEEVPDQKVRTAFFKIGQTKLELLESTSPDGTIAGFIEKRGEGIHHLAFSVKDGVQNALNEMEAKGEEVPRDAFGHVKLDAVNPGKWFGKQFADMIGAEKVLVQKSGYFARAAAANADDLRLIKSCTDLAVECAFKREGGVIGHDENANNVLRACEFERIKGGKPFDTTQKWFKDLLSDIAQA